MTKDVSKGNKNKTGFVDLQTERVADVLEMKDHNVSGAHSAMYVRSKKSSTSTRGKYI